MKEEVNEGYLQIMQSAAQVTGAQVHPRIEEGADNAIAAH